MKNLPNGLCTGCMVCSTICPHNAITFKIVNGFYKRIVSNKCIKCGLCEKICPILSPVKKNKPSLVVSAVLNNKEILNKSASGGAFAGIANSFLNNNGFVCGAVIKNKLVFHELSDNDFTPFQGSKYLQSKTDVIFSKVEILLKDGEKLLFSGTPCQVAALYSYVRQKKINYSNLYTIELVCHGVPSFSLLSIVEGKYKKRIKEIISFRDKKDGWNSHYAVTMEFEDGSTMRDSNCFFKGFTGFKMLRKSCYNCQYKDIARCADLTIGDFWGSDLNKYKDGHSLILVNTLKGRQILNNSSSLFNFNIIQNEEIWIKGNPNLIKHFNPYKFHPFRLFLNWNIKHLPNSFLRALYCGDFAENKLLKKMVHAIDLPYEKILQYERNKSCKKMLSDFSN